MDEAALAQGARKTGLDGADQAGRAVSDHEERIGQPAALEILEERRAARGVLLGARRPMEQYLACVLGNPQAQSTASRGIPACSRSATPSTKK